MKHILSNLDIYYRYHFDEQLYKISNILGYIVASHLTWGSVITVARGHTNGVLGDCGHTSLRLNTLNNHDLT